MCRCDVDGSFEQLGLVEHGAGTDAGDQVWGVARMVRHAARRRPWLLNARPLIAGFPNTAITSKSPTVTRQRRGDSSKAGAPVPTELRLVDRLCAFEARTIVRPACPGCGRGFHLHRADHGKWLCRTEPPRSVRNRVCGVDDPSCAECVRNEGNPSNLGITWPGTTSTWTAQNAVGRRLV